MLFPTLRNTKNPLFLKKNITLPAHSPTDSNGITEQTENIKGMSLEKKVNLLVTNVSTRMISIVIKAFYPAQTLV